MPLKFSDRNIAACKCYNAAFLEVPDEVDRFDCTSKE